MDAVNNLDTSTRRIYNENIYHKCGVGGMIIFHFILVRLITTIVFNYLTWTFRTFEAVNLKVLILVIHEVHVERMNIGWYIAHIFHISQSHVSFVT